MLWHSFGTMAALLQEIINIYPAINPPVLTAHQSNRVCNALALLQCVASHPDTRCGGWKVIVRVNLAVQVGLPAGPHPALSVSLPPHRQQDQALRVSPPHLPR